MTRKVEYNDNISAKEVKFLCKKLLRSAVGIKDLQFYATCAIALRIKDLQISVTLCNNLDFFLL